MTLKSAIDFQGLENVEGMEGSDFIEGIEIWLEEHGPRFMVLTEPLMDIIDGVTDAIANVGEEPCINYLFEVASEWCTRAGICCRC